ncbi:MAG: DNA-binding protein, partial [Acidimicrobiales bacterium]
VVQLDGVDVRALVPVTDTAAATSDIGEPGRLVFRRMAMRSGISDYGYAFAPEGGA